MKITVKLFSTLRRGRFDVSGLELEKGVSVSGLLKLLKIDEREAAIVLINGVHGEMDSVIRADDEVAIFPPTGGG